MSGKSGSTGADRPSNSSANEQDSQVPRGIEVLVKKASVDLAFKKRLLTDRLAAAAEIGLKLAPSEELILRATPVEQLESIISQTSVPDDHRRVFLGQAAAAMLAVLTGAGVATAGEKFAAAGGARPMPHPRDVPPIHPQEDTKKGGTFGNQPDRPPTKPKPPQTISQQIVNILAKRSLTHAERINERTNLTLDLNIDAKMARDIRSDIFNELGVMISDQAAAKISTAGQLFSFVVVRTPMGKEVVGLIAPDLGVQPAQVTSATRLPRRLIGTLDDRKKLAKKLSEGTVAKVDEADLRRVSTVGNLIESLAYRIAQAEYTAANAPPLPPKLGATGIRP